MAMNLRIKTLLTIAGLAVAGAALPQAPNVPTYGPLREPVPVPGAKPVALPGIEALKGDGLYYIYGSKVANLRASATAGEGNRFALTETSNDLRTGMVNGHIDAGNFVLNGERRAVGRPNFAIPAPDGTVYLVYSGESSLRLAVTLQAFDVSDLPIQPFLRTPENYPKKEAPRAGSARFPAKSIAYLVVARFVDDVLVLPGKESFTGATNTAQFVTNFSKQIPYCLAYEDRQGAKPYAMMFTPGAKKGPVHLYAAKAGTLFCDKGGAAVIGEGTWEERTVGGTRAVVLSFPANVDPLDTGVSNFERESARIAFIEPTRGTPGVRPGKLYQAGAKIYDFQYRFNKTAADAVRQSIGVP
jgi:hypothetical protein